MWWRRNSEKKVSERQRDLEEQILTLKREQHSLQLEFEELHDVVRHSLQRISQRAKRVDEANTPQEPAPVNAAAEPVGGAGHLTDHQKQIQQAILKRRANIQ